ncbi:MAG: NYN domain-containing protein [Dehalococcoidia bacterium]
MQANIYVDGFNLYYRALRRTHFKWLDLDAVCRRMLPEHTVHRIHYFTARISARPNNPQESQRQDLYLRALETIPHLTITYGNFLTSKAWAPRADGQGMVQVHKTEEKGSDVNLASLLVHDAHRHDFEIAAVLSNDSDLTLPLALVGSELGLPVVLLSPVRFPHNSLVSAASEVRKIRSAQLRACQFPARLVDAQGSFQKPPTW